MKLQLSKNQWMEPVLGAEFRLRHKWARAGSIQGQQPTSDMMTMVMVMIALVTVMMKIMTILKVMTSQCVCVYVCVWVCVYTVHGE